MKKALIILRVSDAYQEKRHSLDKQEEQALTYCQFKEYKVYKVLKTVVSGRKNDRTDFLELEKEVEKNSFDVLVFMSYQDWQEKLWELSLKEKLLDQLKHLETKNNVVKKQLTQLLIDHVTLDEEGNSDIV